MLCGQSRAVGASCAPDTLDDVPSFWADVTFLSVLPFPAPGGGWVSGHHAALLVDGVGSLRCSLPEELSVGSGGASAACFLRVSAAVPVGPRGCTAPAHPGRGSPEPAGGVARCPGCCCVLGDVMSSLWLSRVAGCSGLSQRAQGPAGHPVGLSDPPQPSPQSQCCTRAHAVAASRVAHRGLAPGPPPYGVWLVRLRPSVSTGAPLERMMSSGAGRQWPSCAWSPECPGSGPAWWGWPQRAQGYRPQSAGPLPPGQTGLCPPGPICGGEWEPLAAQEMGTEAGIGQGAVECAGRAFWGGVGTIGHSSEVP